MSLKTLRDKLTLALQLFKQNRLNYLKECKEKKVNIFMRKIYDGLSSIKLLRSGS